MIYLVVRAVLSGVGSPFGGKQLKLGLGRKPVCHNGILTIYYLFSTEYNCSGHREVEGTLESWAVTECHH